MHVRSVSVWSNNPTTYSFGFCAISSPYLVIKMKWLNGGLILSFSFVFVLLGWDNLRPILPGKWFFLRFLLLFSVTLLFSPCLWDTGLVQNKIENMTFQTCITLLFIHQSIQFYISFELFLFPFNSVISNIFSLKYLKINQLHEIRLSKCFNGVLMHSSGRVTGAKYEWNKT